MDAIAQAMDMVVVLNEKLSAVNAQRDQFKAALRKIELLPLHTILMGAEPNSQCGHCIAKQVLKETAGSRLA